MTRELKSLTSWPGRLKRECYRFLLARAIAIVCLCCSSVTANAQATGLGVISGIVADSSGAVIPGAKITVTNMATGVLQDTVTNATGYYEVDALIPGKYRVLVVVRGFKDLLRLLRTSMCPPS
jgi:hypothetical protein